MRFEEGTEDFNVASWADHESYSDGKQSIDSSPRELSWNGDSDGYSYDVDSVAHQLMEHAKKVYSSGHAASYDSDSSTGAPNQYLGCIGALCPKQSTGPKKSGPRQAGEGCEEMQQGITTMKELPGGGMEMRITLLAAGFVIGSGGTSVHQIIQKTGATVQSWSEKALPGKRACRAFRVLGKREKIAYAVEIIQAAVQRYKDLCEGKSQGIYVQRQQYVHGVEFCYQPPPKSKCPTAALLGKDRNSRSNSRRRGRSKCPGEGRPCVPEAKHFPDIWTNGEHTAPHEQQGRSGCRSPPSVLPHESSPVRYDGRFRHSSNEYGSCGDIVTTVATSAAVAAATFASSNDVPMVAKQPTRQDAYSEERMAHCFQQFTLFDEEQGDGRIGVLDRGHSSLEDLSSGPSSSSEWLANEFRPCWLDSSYTAPEFLPGLRC